MTGEARIVEYGGFAGSEFVLKLPNGETVKLGYTLGDRQAPISEVIERAKNYLAAKCPEVTLSDEIRLATM